MLHISIKPKTVFEEFIQVGLREQRIIILHYIPDLEEFRHRDRKRRNIGECLCDVIQQTISLGEFFAKWFIGREMVCLNELCHIVHIHSGGSEITANGMYMRMNQFDIPVKSHTRHYILVNLNKVKDHRHQDIHLLFNRHGLELCKQFTYRMLTHNLF